MILKPFFDLLSLGRKDDALPIHRTCSLVVHRHYVGVLIEHFDDAWRSRTLETVTAKLRFVLCRHLTFQKFGALNCLRQKPCEPVMGVFGLRVHGSESSLMSKRSSAGFHDDSASPCCVRRSEGDSAWRLLFDLRRQAPFFEARCVRQPRLTYT